MPPAVPVALVAALLVPLLFFLPAALSPAHAFGFEQVAQRAQELAAAPYRRPPGLPKELQGLSYDEYRDIRFKRDRFLWGGDSGLPFEVAFFHQGLYFEHPVRIHEVTPEGVRPIEFDPANFDYGKNKLDLVKLRYLNLGFAGFRVHYPINTSGYKDEVLVFLGASYFRALGRGQQYGASARGLAIDTALPSGEEFPRFTEFWLERPAPGADSLVVHALLDSPRVAGAYRFVLRPGVDTVLEVKARLFLREGVGKLGVAPLTSMYLFGENHPAPYEDYRPEVHDSDGLAIHSSTGEWLWRPLVNPRRLLVTSFALTNPRGFGLLQRDREFMRYEDTEVRHELRPGVWIEPRGDWGAGRVELVQIPAPDETNDNIVAYWVPDQAPAPKQAYDFEYRLYWQKDAEVRPPSAWVTQSRRGRGFMKKPDDSIQFVMDWEGPALARLKPDAVVEVLVEADANAKLLEQNVWRNDPGGGWRTAVRLKRLDASKPVELRAYLRSDGQAISETWAYVLPPQ
ncbi:MAG TPA: glucan biosynthesis protein G [Burkholderiales bacterium]|nr:glucan biosynthesis protein G [Burkholderiales bacterium]